MSYALRHFNIDETLVQTEACLPEDAAGQSYYDHDFDDFYDILKKNKSRLFVNPSRREKSELLKDEFPKSVGKLGPLREKIDQTDKLIDKIVYELYGLTEEEIRIVEAGSPGKCVGESL